MGRLQDQMMDLMAAFDEAQMHDYVSGVLIHENQGYDFAAWASAINGWPWLHKAGVRSIPP